MQNQDWQLLKAAIARLPPGPFHFSDLYGEAWQQFWIGERVQRGHDFQRAVAHGEFPGVLDTGKKRGGGRVYLRQSDS